MKKINHIWTNTIRTIRRSFPRFVSLMVMSLLGVFVFAGLMATAPDMIKTLDCYLDDTDSYDIRVISDMGIMAEDIDSVKSLTGVKDAKGGKQLDVILEKDGNEIVVQCNTMTEGMNTPEVLDGRLPKFSGEIAFEKAFLERVGYKIGDTITIDSGSLKTESFTIVGTIKSPLYLNPIDSIDGRGKTSIGQGTINYYAYISEGDLDFDYYTVLYVTASGAKELVTSESDYNQLVERVLDEVRSISSAREAARYDSIIENGNKQIEESGENAYKELDEKWAELKPQIQAMLDGELQLTEAESELLQHKAELEDAKTQLDAVQQQLSESEKQLAEARSQLDFSASELATNKARLDQAEAQLANARTELDQYAVQLKTAKEQLDSAKNQLDTNKAQLDQSEVQLAQSKAELDAAEKQLSDAKAELDAGKAQYNQALQEAGISEAEIDSTANLLDAQITSTAESINALNQTIASIDAELETIGTSAWDQIRKQALEYSRQEAVELRNQAESTLVTLNTQRAGISALQSARDQIAAGEAAYNENYARYQEGLYAYNIGKNQYDEGKALYEAGLNSYHQGLSEYNAQMTEYQNAENQYNQSMQEFLAGKAQYESGQAQYESGKQQYDAGQQQYESGKAQYESGKQQYESGLASYQAGLASYEAGKTTYEENLNKYKNNSSDYDIEVMDLNRSFSSMEEAEAMYEEARADIAAQIEEAYQKLDSVEMPKWYMYDRTGYGVYGDYINDSNSVKNLAGIFPVIFFLVAVLVSLISMNRMVEEERMEIGTMKSLGFDNSHIRKKYLHFSLISTITGGVIGAASGLFIIPNLIFNIYKLLFDIPDLMLTFQPVTTLLGFVITVFCVCGTSILTVQKVLREKPSELMRPKAPKNGKRILLEKIPVIWGHLSFSRKITIRNLSRYKKRVCITIGGIAGCAALMLTGFGIRDSIMDIPRAQYEDVFHFDGMAMVKQLETADFIEQNEITDIIPVQQISATAENQDVYIFVTEDEAGMERLITLSDEKTGELIRPEAGKAIVTEKFASTSSLQLGDILDCVDIDQNSYSLEVSGIVVNYVAHYIFITRDTYESFGHTYSPNIVYFDTIELTEDEQNLLAKKILTSDNVLTVSFATQMITSISSMLGSLNSVVLILLLLSAMLSFVVLFNLSNININERKREIATLKVLGFFDREVDNYITRETIIITGAGILIGLVLGVIMSHFVVLSIEIAICRFINKLQPISFVYTTIFAILFTLLVNLITHFNLRKIDMIDSLKSVE